MRSARLAERTHDGSLQMNETNQMNRAAATLVGLPLAVGLIVGGWAQRSRLRGWETAMSR